MHYSQVVAEGSMEGLKKIFDHISQNAQIKIIRNVTPAMVMVRHRDSVEGTPFYMGEAFVLECEVEVDRNLGYGCVLGYEPERAFYAAVVDAVLGSGHKLSDQIKPMIDDLEKALYSLWEQEAARVASTRVNFDVKKG
ncbi:MAG: phosphonate C-P lyase system protein PhnG [Clostridia bacterium]|nr:phosphonate C-P lyase system protein PhnG [Clostridia bacterium]